MPRLFKLDVILFANKHKYILYSYCGNKNDKCTMHNLSRFVTKQYAINSQNGNYNLGQDCRRIGVQNLQLYIMVEPNYSSPVQGMPPLRFSWWTRVGTYHPKSMQLAVPCFWTIYYIHKNPPMNRDLWPVSQGHVMHSWRPVDRWL